MNQANARGGLAAEAREEKAKAVKKVKQPKAMKVKAKRRGGRKERKAREKTNNGAVRFDKILGFSPTAVIRKLGREGVSKEDAIKIMKANKVKIPEKTLIVHLCLKARPPAPLTKDQIAELKGQAA